MLNLLRIKLPPKSTPRRKQAVKLRTTLKTLRATQNRRKLQRLSIRQTSNTLRIAR